MSDTDLLASVQADLVYILMRVVEGPTCSYSVNGDDFGPQLILTMNASSTSLSKPSV